MYSKATHWLGSHFANQIRSFAANFLIYLFTFGCYSPNSITFHSAINFQFAVCRFVPFRYQVWPANRLFYIRIPLFVRLLLTQYSACSPRSRFCGC